MGLHFIINQAVESCSRYRKHKLIQKTQVRLLAREDTLEKEAATYFPTSILAWEISPAEEPGRLQCVGATEEPNRT